MNFTTIITGIVSSLCTLILGLAAKKFDWKKEQRKAEMEEESNDTQNATIKMQKTNDEWERMYKLQIEDNKQLKKDYNELRKEMYELQKRVNDMNEQIEKLNAGFEEKEQGYLLQIDALKSENEDLRSENEILKEKLKGGE
ncbi:hypothetical protein [Tetragenococcus halophilus]|uniref:hypothetical protein n=1 Tax=Tetragenococcus halophilus TaxID=51669 RepID=UPI002A923107|nr:hypothetical protein TEHSL10_11350 [Tetragenococcus halophilus]